MAGPPPDGQPAPDDGHLPESALNRLGERGFGIYVHVPFCAARCGYCDFNTYTPSENAGSAETWLAAALAEIDLAGTVLAPAPGGLPRVDTIFVGGGTPSLLPVDYLARVVERVGDVFGLTSGAEITTEANPESVDAGVFSSLRSAGFTRVSLGMQSARSHVLAVLDRRHTPGRAVQAAQEARAAGFAHVNLDLIYGTPGETDEDWAASLAAVVAAGVDHVSAYSLIVEDGTRLARQIGRGVLPMPDDDVLADRYLMADEALTGAGLHWYEVSNWAADEAARCRHNELYWRSGDWWGVGPGAHSHVGGVRWWNVRHPARYADRLAAKTSPAQAREVLEPDDRRVEDVLLRLRLAEGLPLSALDATGRTAAVRATNDGLLDGGAHRQGRAVLTLRGRLLADAVVRALLT
ncbi:radical SAM family heme chaperone HemW [Cryptosporangium arvum]|uniref:Heme chaperone HemW n=1 Tax=Cryptosporangium arvum DSM 44712 TaxID=927661 RepID=A0A010YJL5_9ACTN|nr:radical SAM family heme chaperone HemW [Cryptosporangium arvum]EXG80430.1 putative oxygen-independent coproporphyrinogen III oxidase [Cryptosporangium arvum DSM 44712]